ncbi:hypothetical protein EYM_01070 [Ignicoccus islandicus DSM 13165]|uniref:Uncharacterized protein n=1 Tax=Ignicoccus islandicus DSM 13165 TaxID=940295 RepID=A0A0U3EA43_9CREN|nr:hypothetical protein EYM_01070 [Ignicoccus islandicus DSM 13165]
MQELQRRAISGHKGLQGMLFQEGLPRKEQRSIGTLRTMGGREG